MAESSDLVLDRLIHGPARLAILPILPSVRAADFVFLPRTTGLTQGDLSSHLTKLEEAGPVRIEESSSASDRMRCHACGTVSVRHRTPADRVGSLARTQTGGSNASLPHRTDSGGRAVSPIRLDHVGITVADLDAGRRASSCYEVDARSRLAAINHMGAMTMKRGRA